MGTAPPDGHAGWRGIGGTGLLVLAAGLSGCAGSPGDSGATDSWTGTVDTAADGRVTVANTGGGAWTRDTVRARRTLLLGEAGISGGSEATTFGDVTGLAVDDEGRIYVGDRLPSSVRVFGPDGNHLGPIGGEGEGPGEFRWPDGLTFGPDGRLYVAETAGVTVMGAPAGGHLPDEQIDSWQTVVYPQVYRPFRVACDGTIYYPHLDHDPTLQMYLRYRRGGHLRDTLMIPELEGLPTHVPHYRTGPGGGRMVPGVDHPPLAPVPSWDVTRDGVLLIGRARRYELRFVGAAGDTLRVARRDVRRRTIPDPVRRESTEALRTRLDTLPVPVEEVENLPEDVAGVELPTRYPAHREVRFGRDGRVWVERPASRDRSDAAAYDVFDRFGVFLGTLLLPGRFDPGKGITNARMRPRPVFTDDAVYGVVEDTVTGVQRVARFSYELPEREDGAPDPPDRACSRQESDAGR